MPENVKPHSAPRRISRENLMTLEDYAKARKDFRARVLEHKRPRTVHLGEHVTLLFEDELTIRYQVQEMLRIEKIFEEGDIEEEIAAYNPLVPDGSNLKATMLIEFEDVAERRAALAKLRGIERRVWVQAAGCSRVFAIADEDLPRENEEKTSSVHFLRFELTQDMIGTLKQGGALGMGIDHPEYQAEIPAVGAATRQALVADFG
jgi:hypothetical protein